MDSPGTSRESCYVGVIVLKLRGSNGENGGRAYRVQKEQNRAINGWAGGYESSHLGAYYRSKPLVAHPYLW